MGRKKREVSQGATDLMKGVSEDEQSRSYMLPKYMRSRSDFIGSKKQFKEANYTSPDEK